MSSSSDPSAFASSFERPSVVSQFTRLQRRYQAILDRLNGKPTERWIATLVLSFVFFFRVIYFQGWYIVTYALGIYVLNLFILYLSPKIDPAEEDGTEHSTATDSGRFKVFIRRLPEFKFWYYLTRALVICLFLSLFRIFDVPVFWPILLMYFIVLFVFTMRKQILHMYKYNYRPWTTNKPTYLP